MQQYKWHDEMVLGSFKLQHQAGKDVALLQNGCGNST